MTQLLTLGVDPSHAHLGWGLVSRAHGRLECLAHGEIVTAPDDGSEYERARAVVARLWEDVAEHTSEPPDVWYEGWCSYGRANGKQAHSVGVVIGALLAAPGRVTCIGRAQDWRRACGLAPTASKREVAARVQSILGLHERLGEHESDALAIAIVGSGRRV